MDLSSVDTSVLVSCIVYVVAFLVGCIKGRDAWLRILAASFCLCGVLWFLVPHAILQTQMKSEPEVSLSTYGRFFGSTLIGMTGVMAYLYRSTGDNTVLSNLFLTTFIGSCLHLLASVHFFFSNPDVFQTEQFYAGTLGVLLLAAGCLVFYYPLRYKIGHSQFPTPLNLHLRVNAVIFIMGGVMFYAFPDIFLLMNGKFHSDSGSDDVVHQYLMRVACGYALAHGIMSLLACGFLFESDKKAIFKAQIVAHALKVLAVLFAAIAHEAWSSPWNILVFLLLEALFMVNALMGLQAPSQIKDYKST